MSAYPTQLTLVWCYSAFFIFTGPISDDLHVAFTQQSWIITAYAVTFAAFLLFWGRVSDLYSAKPVFTWGFLTLGVLSLVTSFVPEKMSFFILRALAGIAGATLIPASYRLIAYVFDDEAEIRRAFIIFGMSGTIANVTGTLIAGVFQFITAGGQMAGWRWFFRLLALIIIPVSLLAFYAVPKPQGGAADCKEAKWKRLDIVGSFIMLSAIILLILGLTLGASYGWKKPGFLVPFLLSVLLFPSFFVWESRLSDEHALLPSKTWTEIPNFALFIALALLVYPWWGANFLAFVELFTKVHGEKAIIAAVRLLPQGIIAFAVSMLLTFVTVLVKRPRYLIIIGMLFALTGYILFTRTDTFIGVDYWRFLFPGMIIGSGGMLAVFMGTSVGVMTSVPADMAGVAGAVLQVSFQVGSAVGLGIQAGLLTVNPGGLENPANVKASFYFMLGWTALWLIGFVALYRAPPAKASSDEESPVAIVH